MNWIKLLDFVGMLDKIVASVSGDLRTVLVKSLKEARAAAAETDNKYDDILMFFLCFIFQVDKE